MTALASQASGAALSAPDAVSSALTPLDPSRLGPRLGARVVVAGGCGGMGRALVRALCETGVQVAVLDQPSALAQHPPPEGVLALAMDGSDANSVRDAFAAIQAKWPSIDGFCNLIGFMKSWVRIADMPIEAFDEVVAGNLRPHFLCAQAALPLLHASGQGAMVNVSSTLGMDVGKGYVHYSACKAGIIALTKGLARENAPRVRVNAIAPGLTDTAFLQGGTGRPAVFEAMDPQRYAARVPLGRVAVAEDMVGPILFLLGDASRYVNGETMIVDGGVYTQ
jgi:NAD(P)-dependent dehydrogenase (short-subunit alcohol dehydrogenase family)